MDEDGVDVAVEDEEYLPMNQDPPIFYYYFQAVVHVCSEYGWYLLVGLCLAYYFYLKLRPMVRNYMDMATVTHKKMDSSEIERRQLSMEAHRRRLQEEHDRKAAEYAAKQAELDQKKRQEKLEDWDRHQSGLGYKSKAKKTDESSSDAATVVSRSKKKLRDSDYSPLTGSDGPSCSWRPSRRGPAAGGG